MREIINEEKLINIILIFLNHEGMKDLTKEKLYKCLYFADFRHFELYEDWITDLKYYAHPSGPVPETLENTPKYKELIEKLIGEWHEKNRKDI